MARSPNDSRRRPVRTARRVAGAVGVGLALATYLPAVAGASWLAAGGLSPGRAAGTSTALADGRVLVAGGRSSALGVTATTRLYDPRFDPLSRRITGLSARARSRRSIQLSFRPPGPWRAPAPMHDARGYHTATLLPDGRVLVAGGFRSLAGAGFLAHGDPLASAELYDPARRTWTPTGRLGTARALHTATLLGDGRVLVAGGVDAAGEPLRSAELYDPRTGSWTQAAPMAAAHAAHTATALPGGRVLVAGGGSVRDPVRTPDLIPTRASEIYDPRANAWTSPACPDPSPGAGEPSPCLHVERVNHAATALSSGAVLVSGGDDVGDAQRRSAELFDPATNSWTATASMAAARSQHTSTRLADGSVLVAAGRGQGSGFAEIYDPPAAAWRPAGTLRPRRAHAAALLGGPRCGRRCGEVLVVGGETDTLTPDDPRFLTSTVLFDRTGAGARATRGAPPRRYVVKQSRRPITSARRFARARSLCRRACVLPVGPRGAVTVFIRNLRPATRYFYALRAVDARGRRGPVSRSVGARTRRR